MKRLTLFLTFILLAASAVAAKQPVTHETLWLMKRVGVPSVSPDGRWVAFSVTDPAYDPKEQSSDLWIAAADASAKPRRITFTKAAESDVTWAADSRRIAFTTKREGDEQNQLYVLDIAGGGEAQPVTSVATGVSSPRFSHDGRSIVFVSSVKTPQAKERKANVRVYESFPIRNWDRWIDPDKQPHLFVQPLTDGEKATDILAGTQLVASPGFSGTPQGEGGETIRAEFAPDDQSVVFAVMTTRNQAAYADVPVDLYRVAVSGGEPQRIAHDQGTFGRTQFSPDGRTLYATFTAENGLPYNNTRLVAFDWPSMTNRRDIVGQPFDRSVGGYAITPDGRNIYFTAEDAGLEKIYVVSSKGGDARLAMEPQRGVYTDLDIADRAPSLVMVGRWGSSTDPQQVVRIDPAAKTRRNITDFDAEKVATLDWQPPRHFWFTNKDGLRIHNMIVVPENFDPAKKYPLFVLIHGGAANMWRDQISLRWNYHLLAKPGYVMLMTDYRGSTGYGEKFAQAIQKDPLRGPGNDVNAAADEAIRRFPFIDGTRQVAGGASYGGHLANWLEATTTRYKCLISHAGLSSLMTQWGTSDSVYGRERMVGGPFWETSNKIWLEQSPLTYAANFKTPILLSVGERDFRVPMNNTLEMWTTLQRQRVPSKLLVWPEENHWILSGENSRFFYQQGWDWIARWINT
ncbi:MAG TPA: S9 family peptidase [Thermoanaerobaculia bacterium]|nr:S9 family peptidase [Thermoanaerobaculia bacterium]